MGRKLHKNIAKWTSFPILWEGIYCVRVEEECSEIVKQFLLLCSFCCSTEVNPIVQDGPIHGFDVMVQCGRQVGRVRGRRRQFHVRAEKFFEFLKINFKKGFKIHLRNSALRDHPNVNGIDGDAQHGRQRQEPAWMMHSFDLICGSTHRRCVPKVGSHNCRRQCAVVDTWTVRKSWLPEFWIFIN